MSLSEAEREVEEDGEQEQVAKRNDGYLYDGRNEQNELKKAAVRYIGLPVLFDKNFRSSR